MVWAEERIYRCSSQMAKVELRACLVRLKVEGFVRSRARRRPIYKALFSLGVLRKRGSCLREISRRPKTTPVNRFGRYTILPFRYSLTFRVTLDLRRRIELR